MPTQCAYGFSCAAMLMQPGLEAENCPNRDTCGTIMRLTEDERAELYQARIENNRRIVERVMVSPSYAANQLLQSRGCPQTPETIGTEASLLSLLDSISECQVKIKELMTEYTAPPEVEAHRYSVTRPYATYCYNKLTSQKAIFPPQVKEQNVKVLHLSKDSDPRNILGRAGIERRNRVLHLKTQIETATKLLNSAIERVSATSIEDALAEKMIQRME